MARTVNRLTAKAVTKQTKPGYHNDGAGLYLIVRDSKAWVFRFTLNGRKREMGLGSPDVVSLAEARDARENARRLVAQGIDPIEERKAAKLALGGETWGQCVTEYIAEIAPTFKNDAQKLQWENSLAAYGPKTKMLVRDVSDEVVINCLRPIWQTKNETADRVRGRIERIIDYATVKKYRTGENPARWKGHLDKVLAKPSSVSKVKSFDAIPFADLPKFMAELRTRKAHSARALEFLILTTARTGEVTNMEWNEVDGDNWNRPGSKMKAGEAHSIPLLPQALDILGHLPKDSKPFDLSENAMLYLIQKRMGKKFTVHGFRSAFSSWAHSRFPHLDQVIEMQLAHTIGNKSKAAYQRDPLLNARRELLNEWAKFLFGGSV